MTSERTPAPVIAFRDLRFSYGAGAFGLAIEALTIAPHSRVAIVGPSGTGKTTMLNLLSGLDVPQAGHVQVAGTALETLGDAARRRFRLQNLGFVFQRFELVSYLSVLENILYPYRLSPALRLTNDVRLRAQDLARSVGLDDKLSAKPAALSQGEQQRVAVCRALVTTPKLVLADEATGNLDPANKTLILDLLFEQVAKADATLVAVTHDHGLLPRFDRVIDFADLTTGEGRR
ncbi:MAG: ABC transporter ATP-binding protein [Pseudomonadota bacterium]